MQKSLSFWHWKCFLLFLVSSLQKGVEEKSREGIQTEDKILDRMEEENVLNVNALNLDLNPITMLLMWPHSAGSLNESLVCYANLVIASWQ